MHFGSDRSIETAKMTRNARGLITKQKGKKKKKQYTHTTTKKRKEKERK